MQADGSLLPSEFALVHACREGKRGGGAKRKLSVRDRLQRKLLTGRAARTAAGELMHTDAETYKDTMHNRWAEV